MKEALKDKAEDVRGGHRLVDSRLPGGQDDG